MSGFNRSFKHINPSRTIQQKLQKPKSFIKYILKPQKSMRSYDYQDPPSKTHSSNTFKLKKVSSSMRSDGYLSLVFDKAREHPKSRYLHIFLPAFAQSDMWSIQHTSFLRKLTKCQQKTKMLRKIIDQIKDNKKRKKPHFWQRRIKEILETERIIKTTKKNPRKQKGNETRNRNL